MNLSLKMEDVSSPKRRSPPRVLHDVTKQKTTLEIPTAVKPHLIRITERFLSTSGLLGFGLGPSSDILKNNLQDTGCGSVLRRGGGWKVQ
jgi:hypothetical protein